MGEKISVSLPDDVAQRLNDELESYSDNRSAVVAAALREYFGMEATA